MFDDAYLGDMTELRDRLLTFGYPAVAFGVGFVFLATLVDPAFSWETRSLSSIGEANGLGLFALGSTDQLAFLLFNGGLLVGGLAGLPFMIGLGKATEGTTSTVGVVLGLLTLIGMLGVGVAYLDGPLAGLHFPFAATLFFGLTFTLWTFGTAMILGGDELYGVASIWLSNAQVMFWVFWIIAEAMAFTGDDGRTWFAVPEFVAALAFGGWVLATARRYSGGDPTSGGTF